MGHRGDGARVRPSGVMSSSDETLDLLRLAARLGKFGAWRSDLRTGITTWSMDLPGSRVCRRGRQCTNDQILELFAEDSRPLVAAAFAACASHGVPYDLELQTVDEAQRFTWVRVIGVAVRDDAGAITHVQGAFQDIQASKEVSEANRAWATRFRTTLDSLADGFAIIDRNWTVTYANRAAATTVGLVLEEAVGRNYWDLFPEVRGTTFGDHYEAAMERREATRFEDYYAPLDMWLRISVFPVDEGIAISFSDISAIKRERAVLLQANEELERRVQERTASLEVVNADLKAFSYSVAHDLRSPIGRMAGFAKALRHHSLDQLDERGRHFLNRIEASASAMDAMTEGLITLFGVAHRKLELRELDFAALARECVSSFRNDGWVTAKTSVTIDDAIPIRGDASLVAIVISNLVGNALKYSRDRDHPAIHIGSETVDGERRYFVADNGVGFDVEAAVQSLFKPFGRLHGAEFEGSGIGLATAAKIVALHHGRIWARSAPGAGATFYFTVGTEAA